MLRTDDSPAPPLPSRWLVSTAWLADHLRDRNLSVVDASSVPPGKQGDAHADYRQGHIPGAVFFDINAISDHSTELPHMLPGPAQIGVAAGALGISESDTIVVYDSAGLYSAARVWWTFRIFGAKDVFILDGGLPKWKAVGGAMNMGDLLEGVAALCLKFAPVACAARIWGGAEMLRERTGSTLMGPDRERCFRYMARARGALQDDAAFDLAWNEGRSWSRDDAVKYAIELLSAP